MNFFISDSLKDKLDIETIVNQKTSNESNSYELFELIESENKVFISYYVNNFIVKKQYNIKDVNSCIRFKKNMQFKFKSIKNYNNKIILTIFIDAKLFWEFIEDEKHINK